MATLTVQMIREAVEKLRNNSFKSPEPIVFEYTDCTECGVRYGLMDFHDCLGKFDAYRIYYGESTNSVRVRFRKKYSIHSDEGMKMIQAAGDELTKLPPDELKKLEQDYRAKMAFISSPTEQLLQLEESLWES
jgi:hypothetical protein